MNFIDTFFNKEDSAPLYYQLYSHLALEIRTKKLPAGERLPGKRSAAAQLGLSVNTVDAAYQMLAAEGYVEARPRSGFIVNRVEASLPGAAQGAAGAYAANGEAWRTEEQAAWEAAPPQAVRNASASPPPESGTEAPIPPHLPGPKSLPTPARLSAPAPAAGWALPQSAAAAPAPPRPFSFHTGGLDLSLFPIKTWNRLLREVLADEGPALFARGEAAGEGVLRVAIAEYLRAWRGVRCGAGQLVVGAGLEVLVSMLARLLAGLPGGVRFAVENPGYAKTGRILGGMGIPVLPVEVDAEGLLPAALELSGACAAYLTPSHQFPTGAVMPVGRRAALLQWAARGQAGGAPRFIIEDDYDSEFRFDGRPLPCLQGLDGGGRVVYAGTFSRSLAPGLRAAYLVLPPPLLGLWRASYGDYACTVSRPEQHTLARFISRGHFARGLNRMRAAYRRRRDALLAALWARLPANSYAVENAHTGLYLTLRLFGRGAAAIAHTARQSGLAVRALSEYYAAPPKNGKDADALVLGYGGLAAGDIEKAAACLADCIGLHQAQD